MKLPIDRLLNQLPANMLRDSIILSLVETDCRGPRNSRGTGHHACCTTVPVATSRKAKSMPLARHQATEQYVSCWLE